MIYDLGAGIVDVKRPGIFDDICVHMEQCRPGVTDDEDGEIVVKLFNWVQATWLDRREVIGPDGEFNGFRYPIIRQHQTRNAGKKATRRRR